MSVLCLWSSIAAASDAGAHLQVALGHAGPVGVAAFSPDGEHVVTGSDDQTAAVWDRESGSLLHVLAGHRDQVAAVEWSPDGQRIATASWDGTGAVWDAASGRLLRPLVGHDAALNAVHWSPGGERLLTMGDDGTAIVWDPETGRVVRTLAGHSAHLTDCAWSPDGARALTAGADGRVLVWADGQVLARIEGIGAVYRAVWSPDGAHLAIASRTGVGVWDAASGAWERALVGHFRPVFALAWSADGQRIATGSWDETARIWDAATGEAVLTLEHTAEVDAVAWSPDGGALLTATRDGSSAVWDAASGARLAGPADEATHDDAQPAAWAPDGRAVVSGRTHPTLWDPRSGQVVTALAGRVEPVLGAEWSADAVLTVSPSGAGVWDLDRARLVARYGTEDGGLIDGAWSPDGRTLATASATGVVTRWDVATGEAIGRGSHTLRVYGASWSADGRLASASLDHRVIVWGEPPVEIVVGEESADALSWSPDGARIATTSLGRTAVWDAATGALVRTFDKHVRLAEFAATWSPDGQRLVGPGAKYGLTVWTAEGKRVAKLLGHDDVARDVAWSPDGQTLASAGDDGAVIWWDAATGVARGRWDGDARVNDVAFDPAGARLASAGDDNTATIRALPGGEAIVLAGHLGPVRAVSFSADGQRVLTASDDGTARLWDAASGAWLATVVAFPDGTWAVVDPDGRFDGSGDGDVEGLYWVIGGEPYRLAQLRDRYYDPGLLAKRLGLRDEPLRAVPPLAEVRMPPAATLTGPGADGALEIALADRGGGIGPLTVLLNGSDVSDAVRAACPRLADERRCAVDLSSRPTWVPGASNRVEVFTSDAQESARSRGLDAITAADGALPADPPDLWVLAVGSSDYAGEALDLRFAGVDANRFAAAMTLAGARGFGDERTHVRLLSTTAGAGVAARPSRAALEQGFAWLRGADPLDTVVVFLAGHGKAYADALADDYYYVLPGASSFADVSDPTLRARNTWSGRDLAEALARVPASKRVVVLDTCDSGKAGALDLAATRDISSDAVRAHARARERTGAWFLAGAAADQPSYEATRFGQGLLTYALLEGMQGPGLDAESQLLVSRWFGYAEDQVPKYARGIGGVQQPYVRAGAGDFTLGEVPAESRAAIPIGRERPAVVRALVVGEGGAPDRSGLAAAIDQRLRAAGDGADAPFVWFDAPEFERAWQVTGQARADGEGLSFAGFLSTLRADGEVRVELAASGRDVDAVAAAIATQVTGAIR